MSEAHHDSWSEDIAAYTLGALEPERAEGLERHLEDCERCRAELHWLTPAVQALPESVERVVPPPLLRERLLAEVRKDSSQQAKEETRPGERRGALAWLRGSGPLGLRPAVGLAALVLVVAAVAGYAIGVGIGGDSEGGATTVVTGKAPGITAKMVSEGDSGTLQLANVQPLSEDRVLQAWVQRDGEVEPVRALFVPDRNGRASAQLPDMEGVEVVMVTAEPRGGSEAPTSAPIVTVAVPG